MSLNKIPCFPEVLNLTILCITSVSDSFHLFHTLNMEKAYSKLIFELE